jgi:hypothetical protein
MGLFGSKPFGTPAYKVEPSTIETSAAFYPAAVVEAANKQAEAASAAANEALQKAAKSFSAFQMLGILLFLIVLIVGGIIIYDSIAISNAWRTLLIASPPVMTAPACSPANCIPPNVCADGKCVSPSSEGVKSEPSLSQATMGSPTIFSKTLSYVTGSDSSGDLLGTSHNAQTPALIRGTNAPLSAQNEGSYGLQWWMFIRDWNYGFGKEKGVLVRPDSTNAAIKNPSISLHPTENTLKVSVSIFPSGQEGSVSEPAPAGHAGTTDDVFVCEVSDVPLQKWFAVSVTVFSRNLDIYIDGKLVKSCFLPGVPKPAVGDISVTPDGGFSGKMCSVVHYPRMLTPEDAMKFWSEGTTCKADVDTTPGSASASSTGYAVKFGVYDTLGNTVKEFAF